MNYFYFIADVSHVFTPPNNKTTSHVHVCARHGRERGKVLDEKPVKPVRSIQPKPVKPVRQASGKLDAIDNKSFQSRNVKEKSAAQFTNKAQLLVSDL